MTKWLPQRNNFESKAKPSEQIILNLPISVEITQIDLPRVFKKKILLGQVIVKERFAVSVGRVIDPT